MYSKLACSCQFDFFWYRRIASSSLPVRTTTLMRAMFLAVNCASMVAKKNKKFALFSFVSQMYNVFMILSPSRFLQSPDKSRIPPSSSPAFPSLPVTKITLQITALLEIFNFKKIKTKSIEARNRLWLQLLCVIRAKKLVLFGRGFDLAPWYMFKLYRNILWVWFVALRLCLSFLLYTHQIKFHNLIRKIIIKNCTSVYGFF